MASSRFSAQPNKKVGVRPLHSFDSRVQYRQEIRVAGKCWLSRQANLDSRCVSWRRHAGIFPVCLGSFRIFTFSGFAGKTHRGQAGMADGDLRAYPNEVHKNPGKGMDFSDLRSPILRTRVKRVVGAPFAGWARSRCLTARWSRTFRWVGVRQLSLQSRCVMAGLLVRFEEGAQNPARLLLLMQSRRPNAGCAGQPPLRFFLDGTAARTGLADACDLEFGSLRFHTSATLWQT